MTTGNQGTNATTLNFEPLNFKLAPLGSKAREAEVQLSGRGFDEAFVFPCLRRGGFAGAANVVGSGAFKNLFGAFDLVGVFGVDGDEDIAVFDLAFVTLGFQLGNAQADQSSGNATDSSADRGATTGRHDGASGDERADAANAESADSDQPTEVAAELAAGDAASGGAFRGLGVLFVGEVLGAGLVRKQHGNIVIGEVGVLELSGDGNGLGFCFGNADDR